VLPVLLLPLVVHFNRLVILRKTLTFGNLGGDRPLAKIANFAIVFDRETLIGANLNRHLCQHKNHSSQQQHHLTEKIREI